MAPKDPLTAQTGCGFYDHDGRLAITEASLRASIAAAALAERTIWWVSSSTTPQKESDDTRFGDLVRYWLAGQTGLIPPGKIDAALKAALDPSVKYANLADAAFNAAIREFAKAEKKVTEATSDVYVKWDDVDSAMANLKAAQGTAAASAARVRAAVARRALDLAKKHLAEARTARRRLDPDDEKLRQRSKLKILKPLDPAAASLAKGGADPTLVDEALFRAHRSRADMEAWSAVFVVTCVRAAAIHHKLEAIDQRRVHRGRDALLKANSAHSVYIMKARDRAAAGILGTYHAFTPDKRIVRVGDIICTDREDFIERPVVLKDLKKGAILHGDIVTLITTEKGRPVAETIGGNVKQTVRRRRYPLDAQGRLIVSAAELFAQEGEHGTITLPAPLVRVPTKLPATSTRRIFALLSLVEECRPQGKGATARKDAPRGRNERFIDDLLGSLESPFLDHEILQSPAQNQFMSRVERLVAESPFERFMVETQVTRSRASDATAHENRDEHLDTSDAAGHDAEAADFSDEAEFDYSDGEDHAHEDRSPFQPAFAPDRNSISPPETAEEGSFDELAPEPEVDELVEKPDGDDQVLESESEAEQDHALQQERPTEEGSESVESAEVREECEEEPDIDEEATEPGSVDTASVEFDSWAAEGAHVNDTNIGELELNDNDYQGARNYRSYFGESRRPPGNEFDQLTIAQLFGRIYGRANDPAIKGRLTFRDRSLLNVALLAALGRDPELKTHLKAADYQGFSRDQLTEIMIHVAHYAGWPAGHNGMSIVEQFFEEKKRTGERQLQAAHGKNAIVAILFRVEAKPGKRDELINFLTWNREESMKRERGTLRFDIFQDPENEHAFYVYEAYEDAAAFEEHKRNEPFQRWSSLDFQTQVVFPHRILESLVR